MFGKENNSKSLSDLEDWRNNMNCYDDIEVFNNFVEFRNDNNSKHNKVRDILVDMIGDCKNLKVLDLGCGLGEFTKFFGDNNASYICGIDISKREIEYAQKNNNKNNIEYKVMDIKDISEISDKFDLIFSDMVFNYIENYNKMIVDIYDKLNDNGMLIFSMVHPISTASLSIESNWVKDENDNLKFMLDNYGNVSKRERKYFGGVFEFYHRRFEEIINVLINNKFELLELVEPYSTDKEYNRPSFLLIKAKKKNY